MKMLTLPAVALLAALSAPIAAAQAPSVTRVNPDTVARPTGYTHLVTVTGGRTLYVSGQVALDREGRVVGAGDLEAQVTQVFENLGAVLKAGGATFADVVKITVFMRDAAGVPTFRTVRDRYLRTPPPASTLVQVSGLARPEFLIEVEAIAVVATADGRP